MHLISWVLVKHYVVIANDKSDVDYQFIEFIQKQKREEEQKNNEATIKLSGNNGKDETSDDEARNKKLNRTTGDDGKEKNDSKDNNNGEDIGITFRQFVKVMIQHFLRALAQSKEQNTSLNDINMNQVVESLLKRESTLRDTNNDGIIDLQDVIDINTKYKWEIVGYDDREILFSWLKSFTNSMQNTGRRNYQVVQILLKMMKMQKLMKQNVNNNNAFNEFCCR